jgi:hypothetical protein
VKNRTTNTKRTTSKETVRTKRATRKTSLASRQIQHVIPLGNGWVVKSENTTRFTVITDSKQEAIAIATSIAKAKKTGLVIHNKDGRVSNTRSYAASA